jgi:hypothetical protein
MIKQKLRISSFQDKEKIMDKGRAALIAGMFKEYKEEPTT